MKAQKNQKLDSTEIEKDLRIVISSDLKAFQPGICESEQITGYD